MAFFGFGRNGELVEQFGPTKRYQILGANCIYVGPIFRASGRSVRRKLTENAAFVGFFRKVAFLRQKNAVSVKLFFFLRFGGLVGSGGSGLVKLVKVGGFGVLWGPG